MLKLGSTYLIVQDMNKSIAFYEALLQMKVSEQTYDRWAQFNFGNCIALYNPKYDEKLIKSGENLEVHYNNELLKYYKNSEVRYGNNIVLNFFVDNLNTEYERVKELDIGKVTDILYVNISSPYYYFLLEDPNGNTIEITGKYNPH